MITRTVEMHFDFRCCLPTPEGEIDRNVGHTIYVTLHDRAEKFEMKALVAWKDEFLDRPEVLEYIISLADNKCSILSESLKMCRKPVPQPKIDVIDYYEEIEVIKVPEFVLKTISDLERRRYAAKTIERKERIQKTIDELKKEYGIKIE